MFANFIIVYIVNCFVTQEKRNEDVNAYLENNFPSLLDSKNLHPMVKYMCFQCFQSFYSVAKQVFV